MEFVVRIAYSILTLYMLLILIRWLGGYLSLELDSPRLKWIATVTDPLITALRRSLPRLGPLDLSAVVALILVWLGRELLVTILAGAARQNPLT